MRAAGEMQQDDHLMATFFAIFYVDNAYLASRDPDFLQLALDILVSLFARVGLETNVSKTQAMICTPGRIRTQLPEASYRRMQQGIVLAAERDTRMVQCRECDIAISASSMRHHLADQHDVYQGVVVSQEYLEPCPSVLYTAHPRYDGKLACPVPGCLGTLADDWMVRRHLWDLCPFDRVVVPKEGTFPRTTRQDEGMPGWHRQATPMRIGNRIRACPPPQVYCQKGRIGTR